MNKKDITRMAREAGFVGFDGEHKCLREFAALVAAAEREACAKVCDSHAMAEGVPGAPTWSASCADAIRARGQQ